MGNQNCAELERAVNECEQKRRQLAAQLASARRDNELERIMGVVDNKSLRKIIPEIHEICGIHKWDADEPIDDLRGYGDDGRIYIDSINKKMRYDSSCTMGEVERYNPEAKQRLSELRALAKKFRYALNVEFNNEDF